MVCTVKEVILIAMDGDDRVWGEQEMRGSKPPNLAQQFRRRDAEGSSVQGAGNGLERR
jgi:hypothetical protein